MTVIKPKRKVGRPANSGKYGAKTQVMRVPMDRVDDIEAFLQGNNIVRLPLYSNKVAAGAMVQSSDHIDDYVDLNQFLVKVPEASFVLQVSGESMRDAGIFNGDLLIVERTSVAKHGDIVVAEAEGETTVKRLHKNLGLYLLMPENQDFLPIEVTESTRILGIVKHVIHSF